MERIDKYKDIVQEEMTYRASATSANSNIKRHLVVNTDRTDFVVLSFGWKGKIFRHYIVFHIQIKNKKIYIYKNNTYVGLMDIFIKNGISRNDIVIGFLTEFEQSLWKHSVI